MPDSLDWKVLAGIGFTVALFIANLAFDDTLIQSARIGISLACIASATAGMTMLLRVSKSRGDASARE